MTSPPLFDFKAGRVEFNESTGQAKPLAGQGRVTLMSSSEDPSLLGLQWLPRGSHTSLPAGEELLLVPGDVEFTPISECSTGRVIQMRFQSSGERKLFWLQDAPEGDLHVFGKGDREIIEKLNELSNSFGEEEEEEEEAEPAEQESQADVEMADQK